MLARRLIVFSFILFGSWPLSAQAAPVVRELLLNGGGADVRLNVNDAAAAVIIRLTASEPVKWNTIAVCAAADTTCNRTTAVKYFTATAAFTSAVEKTWDGARSSGEAVPPGSYRIKATIKNEAGEEGITEPAGPLIIVELGEIGAVPAGPESGGGGGGKTVAKTAAAGSGSLSAHASQTSLSDWTEKTDWQLSAGRERLALVGAPVRFRAVSGGRAPEEAGFYWSFGDGAASLGPTVTHHYLHPGQYEVVVTGRGGGAEAVARTRVKVLAPQLALAAAAAEEPSALLLTNQADQEVNLGGFSLRQASSTFIFPDDTILPAGGRLVLDRSLTKFSGPDGTLLFSPVGRPVVTGTDHRLAELAALRVRLAAAEAQLNGQRPAVADRLPAAVQTPAVPVTPPQVIELSSSSTNRLGRWLQLWRLAR